MGLLVSQSFSVVYLLFSSNSKMSCPVNTFNKSKEDFIWFVKRAVTDKKSYSHSELYHSLLKLFVDADTNGDGLVSKASFSKLIDAAAAMPRAYGYAPEDSALYKTEAEKDAARQKMFDSMDLKSTGVITFDEWLKFCQEHIAAKTATMDPHPIIDHGSVDQYKTFIKMAEFPAMMNEFLTVPKKHNLPVPSEGQYEALFKKHDPRNDGRLTVDEWMSLASQEVCKKF